MTIEVGKTYITRNGMVVTIESDHSDMEQIYPFFGKILDGDKLNRIAFFMINGRYKYDKESQFDIVKELN